MTLQEFLNLLYKSGVLGSVLSERDSVYSFMGALMMEEGESSLFNPYLIPDGGG